MTIGKRPSRITMVVRVYEEIIYHRIMIMKKITINRILVYLLTFLQDQLKMHNMYLIFYGFWFKCVILQVKTPQEKIVDKVLQCLCSWIYHVRLPAELLHQSPLIPWVISLLRQSDGALFPVYPDSMDLAVDVLVEILRCYPSDSYWNKGLVQTIP
jgi:hypothetical protein